jgi:hypothetical protein
MSEIIGQNLVLVLMNCVDLANGESGIICLGCFTTSPFCSDFDDFFLKGYSDFEFNVDSDDKKKHGSIKKFKNSVHKSVLNAFGSISKASGKVLKKSKSEDMDYVDDAPKNWTLSSSSSTPTFSGTPVAQRPNLSDNQMSNRAYKYMVPNGYKDHESTSLPRLNFIVFWQYNNLSTFADICHTSPF